MATVPEPPVTPPPLFTAAYLDVLGTPHDNPEQAARSSYQHLLTQEIGDVFGLPHDPRGDGERAGVHWFARNFDDAIHALGLAVAQLEERGIPIPDDLPAPPAEAVRNGR